MKTLRIILALIAGILTSCGDKTNANGDIVTAYGFDLGDLADSLSIDSIRVITLVSGDTTWDTLYSPEALDEGLLVFNIEAAEESSVRVLYWVYHEGHPIAAGDQIFSSGDSPNVPDPKLAPKVNAGADTLVWRGKDVAFEGVVLSGANEVTSYLWDFNGDGEWDDSSPISKGMHFQFPDTGLFKAIFCADGALGLQGFDTLKVRVKNPPPVIESFSAPSRVNVGALAEVEVKAHSDFGQLVRYDWDLNGDGKWDTSGTKLTFMEMHFVSAISVTLIVQVVDSDSNRVQDTVEVDVRASAGNLPPEITILYQTDTVISIKDTVGYRVDFTDGNTRADVISFAWDLDGNSNYEKNLSKPDSVAQSYAVAGTYTIRVRIRDSGGDSALASKVVRVVQGLPQVALSANMSNAGIGQSVNFTATASDPNENAKDGSIVQYEWDFEGDGVYDATTAQNSTSHAYPNAYASHSYNAKVRVTDDDGNITVSSAYAIAVTNRAPVVDQINTSVTTISIKKYAVLKINSGDFTDADNNQVDSVTWIFSDGVSSRTLGKNDTLHVQRNSVQSLTVQAVVRDAWGLIDTAQVTLTYSEGTVSVSGVADRVSVINAQIQLQPSVSFSLGQSLAMCEWSINGGIFKSVGNTCDTTITLPNTLYNDYQAIFLATSDVGVQVLDTIKIWVRDAIIDNRDGKYYGTVTIGTQVWMAENLAYLPSVSTTSQRSITLAYYYVYDYSGTSVSAAKAESNYSIYGVLYNWTAAQTACPSGWHLPTDVEWTTLEDYVGGSGEAGTKLKANSSLWASNTGTDAYGFSALPCGYFDGSDFLYAGTNGYWWSATEYGPDNAYLRNMDYGNANVNRYYYYSKYEGFSVRCVQD